MWKGRRRRKERGKRERGFKWGLKKGIWGKGERRENMIEFNGGNEFKGRGSFKKDEK